jgi:hypothetical protein
MARLPNRVGAGVVEMMGGDACVAPGVWCGPATNDTRCYKGRLRRPWGVVWPCNERYSMPVGDACVTIGGVCYQVVS